MMRRAIFSGLLVIAVVLTGGYFYNTAGAVCSAPIAYRIGTLDPRFGLSEGEARNAISDAESLWEDTTGRNLFTYDAHANFTINFIYDDRQEQTNEQRQLSTELDQQKSMSEEVRAKYNELTAQYRGLAASYEANKASYESRLAAYNAEVKKWNDAGGAPQDVYDALAQQKKDLAAQQQQLNAAATQLNSIVANINALGEKGNVLVSAYNNVVSLYNKAFGTEREFTQGDYEGNLINVYQYKDPEELRLVLAHEFGHALSLRHVEGTSSIMYYLMGGQDFDTGLSTEDIAEFQRVCGTDSLTLWPAKW